MQTRWRVLDLFCGAGGAGMGLHRAWPEAEIIGIDIEEQPRYPFKFVKADAMVYPIEGYDFIWASPPCQEYSYATKRLRNEGVRYLDLLGLTVERLRSSGIPYCVENVVGSGKHFAATVMLCGSMFNLGVRRHRLFETSFPVLSPPCQGCSARDGLGDVTGHGPPGRWYRKATVSGHGGNGPRFSWAVWKEAMGIDWMSKQELTQAVPPAYSEYIARQFSLSFSS